VVRASSVRRREDLVAAATALIAERGVDGLRTRDAAARVGITHASLHYHFPTKDDLIRAVLNHVIGERMVSPLVTDESSATERLRGLLGGIGRQTRTEPAHVLVLKELHHYADRDDAARELLAPWFRRWREFLVGLVAAGQAAGEFDRGLDPEATASLLMLVILGLRLGGQLAPDLDNTVVDQLTSLLAAD
jgi:TetR/AcrR family transcriptional regulator, regulator of cefoperazone and chloramphenicol sensitivity